MEYTEDLFELIISNIKKELKNDEYPNPNKLDNYLRCFILNKMDNIIFKNIPQNKNRCLFKYKYYSKINDKIYLILIRCLDHKINDYCCKKHKKNIYYLNKIEQDIIFKFLAEY